LIKVLLDNGADPGLKEGWAVVTAIMKGSDDQAGGLGMVRALIERDYPLPIPEPREGGGGGDSDQANGVIKKKKRKRDRGTDSTASPAKRAKLEDRCKPTAEMLETAVKTKRWDIVDYLTKKGEKGVCSAADRRGTDYPESSELGATPNLNVLKLL
jgi:hypothetical protein